MSGQGAPLQRAMKCEPRQVKREFCPVDKFGVTTGDDLKLVQYKSHINFNFVKERALWIFLMLHLKKIDSK